MSLIRQQLREVWDALRGQQPHRENHLSEIRIRKLRGIEDLRVPFQYPVSVLAGPNASGKSSVLFGCACAYQVPGRSPRDFTPTSLFPNFTSLHADDLSDSVQPTELEFHYLDHGDRTSMVWRRRKSWNRSYMGRKGGEQPKRDVYLRTLANLTNPSEVRGILQLGRKEFQTETLDPDLLIFAHRILPWRYRDLAVIRDHPARDLLFARLGRSTSYSEFHMSSGERSILRLSRDLSQRSEALVLIDEVDTGLHPYTQEQAMLELQRLALRRSLQIVVASHSPVVIESVPPEGRLFLDRDYKDGMVLLAPAYRDIFQKALYGRSRDRLSILCEDAVAEGVIRGVLDVLNMRLGLRHEDVVVGRNTGRDEFPGHVRALGKFDKLRDFILVLDGDSRELEGLVRAVGEEHGHSVQPLFLPGNDPPEQWIWRMIGKHADEYAAELGITSDDLHRVMTGLDRLAEGAVARGDTAKVSLGNFAVELRRDVPEIARIAGRREAERNSMPELLQGLTDKIEMWRSP